MAYQESSECGQLLRKWREMRGMSQLDLSMETDTSTRHISFIETGRSQPSREMILRFANAMEIPPRQVNLILVSAGFPAAYRMTDINDASMKNIKEALLFVVNNQMPNPAWAIDGDWNLIASNTAQLRMMQILMEEYGALSLTDTLYNPEGLRRVIKNWEEVARAYLRRIRREILQGRRDLVGRYERVMTYPGIPRNWDDKKLTVDVEPMVKVVLDINNVELCFYSVVSTFGTAIDISMEETKVESLYAADEVTKSFCHQHLQD